MRPTDDIKRFSDKAAVRTNPTMDEIILNKVLAAQEKTTQEDSAALRPSRRSILMKRSVIKLAVAAAVMAVVSVGIMEFLGTGNQSGVVWAQVAQKVDASRGTIYRIRKTGGTDPNMDWPQGYMMMHRSPLHSLTEWYHGGQIKRSLSSDLEAKTLLWVAHDAKVYYKEAIDDEKVRSAQEGGFTNPKELVDRFLAGTYKRLGERTIDGILCEGIETTDQAAFGTDYPVKSFVGRMWVSVETGYPVLVENERVIGDGGERRQTGMADQFQWDVEVGAHECDIPIPPDYRLMD